MAQLPKKSPFADFDQKWNELEVKITKLNEERSLVVNNIAEKSKGHAETCDDCRRQKADDQQKELEMEAVLNEKIKQLRDAHDLAITAMRESRQRREDFHSANPEDAEDDVVKQVFERDRLDEKIARYQKQQDQLFALAPQEDLLPQIAPPGDDSIFCQRTEESDEESELIRQGATNDDSGLAGAQHSRSEKKVSCNNSKAVVRATWVPAPPIDSQPTSRISNGGYMIPTENFHLDGRKYPIIRWQDDIEEWWHMRCRICAANADCTGFFNDIHDLRVHVNAEHFKCGSLAQRETWCEVSEVTNKDVRRIKVGREPSDFEMKAFKGRAVDSAPVPQSRAAPSHGHPRSTYSSSYGPEGLHPSPPSVMAALEKGATFAQAYAPRAEPLEVAVPPQQSLLANAIAPRGTGFRRPVLPQAQPRDFQPPTPHTRRPPPSVASDSPVAVEPVAQPDHGKKSRTKQQQSQLQMPVTKVKSSTNAYLQEAGSSTAQVNQKPRGTQTQKGLGKRAKSDGSTLRNRFNAENEQHRHHRLSNEFGEEPTPVAVAHGEAPQDVGPDEAPQDLPRTRGIKVDKYPR